MYRRLRRYNRYRDLEIDAGLVSGGEDAPAPLVMAALDAEERQWRRGLALDSRRCATGRIGHRALFWVRVPVSMAHLVPVLCAAGGFRVHHATRTYFMFVKTHDRDSPEPPLYGTHYARVECVVVEDGSGRVLLVGESVGSTAPYLKLVTGSVDLGEYVGAAVEREILEETGVRARFRGVLGVANRLGTRFGRDEILIGCLARAPSGQCPVPSSAEIGLAEWMDAGIAAERASPSSARWIAALSAQVLAGPVAALVPSVVEDIRGGGHDMLVCAPP